MAEGKPGLSKGCLIALIVAGVVLLILIAMSVVCYIYKDEIIGMGLDKTADMVAVEIKANLHEDLTAEEVDDVMGRFKQAIKDKKLNEFQMKNFIESFQRVMDDRKIDPAEGKKLIDEIRVILGDTPAEIPAATPTDTVIDTSSVGQQ